MMAGVAGGIQTNQSSTAKLEAITLLGDEDAIFGHGQQLAVQPVSLRLAVHRLHGGEQFRGIGHVPRSARMHDQARFRKRLHHGPRAAGMIEMYVGQEHVGHVGGRQTQLLQRSQGARQGRVAGRIHHGDLAVLDDEMDGGELGPDVTGIESVDTVLVVQQFDHVRPRDSKNFKCGEAPFSAPPAPVLWPGTSGAMHVAR